MTLTTPYSATFIVGDGETKTFSYLFEEVSENFITVTVYNTVSGTTSTPTYIVDTDQKQVIFGDDTPAPTADDVVCIYRDTPVVQDVQFRTLHGYDAKTMENILSKIVAMIQEIESKYLTTDVLQGDPWQIDLLSSADDGATLNIDYTAKKFVKGLYFKITNGNLQVSEDGSNYITLGNKDELDNHIADLNNPHHTSLVNLTDTNIINPVNGQFMMFDGLKWKNVYSSATASWGTILGNIADQTDLQNALGAKVNIDGTSIMTAPLKFMAGSMRGAVGPYLNGVGFWKLDSQANLTLIATISDSQFIPNTTNAINLGSSTKKWKDLYLGGKAYVATLNNGADLTVPNKSGTLATMSDVELAARSGRMLTDQGVWYAKMYSATVPPAAEDGTNYADFSQVDGDSNPIIVIYERQSGAWVQTDTITPPADYDGYVPITSKIWDIAEQTGQQGGRILWNHVSKEFTPYPTIISFEDIEITGDSTVIMPLNPSGNQIVNKNYVDNHIPTGLSTYHPSLFAHEWDDKLRDDVQWLRADTFSWQAGSAYEAAYKHLRNDMYQWYSWEYNGTTIYTKKRYPEVGEKAYTSSALTTEFGEITAIDDGFVGIGITVGGNHYDGVTGASVVPTTETIAGVTVQYIPAEDGHKIVTDFHTSEVEAVYAATGVAWYYIIDYGFYRFKLPRTKFAETGLRDTVGNYVEPGLPNITGDAYNTNSSAGSVYFNNHSGAFKRGSQASAKYSTPTGTGDSNTSLGFDASLSNAIYGNSNTVQPPATQMYLYFYVGEFTQTALQNTAGLNASLFNGKADIDLSNITQTGKNTAISWLMPDYANGISIATTDVSYTAPSAGWFYAQIGPATSDATISVNGVRVIKDGLPNVSGGCGHMLPVSENDVITWTPGIYEANFFPCKGA